MISIPVILQCCNTYIPVRGYNKCLIFQLFYVIMISFLVFFCYNDALMFVQMPSEVLTVSCPLVPIILIRSVIFVSQPAFTSSKLKIGTLEQCAEYVQS